MTKLLVNRSGNHVSHVTTVRENELPFMPCQRQRAIKARELYENLGAPTIASLKTLLKYNLIKNCDVSVQDVEIAERIFGPDIAALKGKSVRQNPNQVLDDWIEIPEELREIYYDRVLCVDLMFMNGIPFLTAIDRTIRYRTVAVFCGADRVQRAGGV